MRELEDIRQFLSSNIQTFRGSVDAETVMKDIEQSFYARKLDKVLTKDGFNLTGFNTTIETGKGEAGVSVAYSKRHKGIFPFPHDHCYITICNETHCLEIEYPCNIEWPWPFDVFA